MKLFEKKELKLLWPFYLSQFIEFSFFIWIAFYVIYFTQIGLSFFQISILFAVWGFSKIIFEIPTGAIADIFGRKFSVVLGNIIYGFSLIFVPIFNNFYFLIFLFVLLGLSVTLVSGADDALIIDYLKRKRRKDLIQDYFIKHSSIFSLAGIFSGLIGAFTVKYLGLKNIWTVAGIAALIGTSVIFFFVDEKFNKRKIKIIDQLKETIDYSKFAVKYGSRHHVLFYLIFASFFISMNVSTSGLMVWQPLLIGLNFKIHWIGYLLSIGGLIAVGIPFLSKSLLKIIGKEKNYLSLMFFIIFLIGISILFAYNWQIAIIIFLVGIFPWELTTPVYYKFFQHHTPSKQRASITSFGSMVDSLGSVIGTLLAGLLLDFIGAKMTVFYSSFLIIPVIILTYLIKEK